MTIDSTEPYSMPSMVSPRQEEPTSRQAQQLITPQEQQHSSMTGTPLNRDVHLAEKLAALQAHGVSAQSLPSSDESVLYLAYGSNLNSQTFLGMRGIRPLSQTNVVVPSLWLTFDLPGIPYAEPCFAATRYRSQSAAAEVFQESRYNEDEGTDDDILIVSADTDEKATTTVQQREKSCIPLLHHQKPTSSPGEPDYSPRMPLVGVVYEVTLKDYARIIATEGGGRGYIDTIIDCYPFPKAYDPHIDPVPEHPGTVPFKAHTLLSPGAAAAAAAHHNPTTTTQPSQPPPLLPITQPPTPSTTPQTAPSNTRPNPFYAQPSARYLSLIRNGAAEHNLPIAYQTYLAQIRPYRITTLRQRVGQVTFLVMWGPLVLLLVSLSRRLAGPDGRSPPWLVHAQDLVFGWMWRSYDAVFARVFGDGERSVGAVVVGGAGVGEEVGVEGERVC
ncbi:uncharacterized protein BP01DRAFT_352457 [Aspergillus saccharolyticus JOP 1030-1]|uniref:gamma-glutamylcyclotransferase n=1 Tax=Aspergillus saccharolyticus JOP 1030-1 TaxID=1450539 RepID=A0A318ZT96_9EURO|nr:hypothetical protein BP01DRAFT_352457 [Aspergillus saccharolyticus JOP 1030-1]PYH49925.1 hypothetical protein BP01DRAFT_352457 [Aspergillus saccharolyticus JOP 1030-1]